MRRYAFQIAARWWEAEFVKRALKFRERADRIEIWRLAACITPCVVGTPDRLANVFVRWTRSGAKTMWGEADLIIVDEAGQSSCDRTASVFGYAPRALVVGDTLQISPVEGEDAPMWGPALAKRNDVFDADALERGLLVGVVPDLVVVSEFGKPDVVEGSVMRAASAASYAHSREPLLPMKGGWLLEHFRCRPGIIAFSNAGWYHGLLQSRRPQIEFPYPEFTHIDVRDDALPVSSRRNLTEANRAAQWLMQERLQILIASNESSLDRAVAIVTPFREQAVAMRQTLKRLLGSEGDLITCGTLHSLQGAERSMIVMLTAYSGSYFLGESELTYFMDRQGTLLNVAVSRARDSFIVIGDRRVFDRARRGTPTAALGGYFMRPGS
jgi:superfamily I DNA and/or RNA helicase